MSIFASQLRWPSLVQDLALVFSPGSTSHDLSAIYSVYGITQEDLKKLLTIPAFREMFESTVTDYNEGGGKQGARVRSLALSQALAERLFRNATSGMMDDKDAVKLLELLLKSAGLLDTREAQVNTQVNVRVSLPLPKGVKKLEHCVGAIDV